ncbi:MAG: hypothetical protein FWG61_08755 [Firmicutes bacterium]|nr:hypothetical protein [Bacillota bacterium]
MTLRLGFRDEKMLWQLAALQRFTGNKGYGLSRITANNNFGGGGRGYVR